MMIRFDYARPLSLADVSIQLDRAMEAQQLAPWQWLSLDPIGDRTTSSSTGEIRDGIFHRPIRSNQGLLARAPFLLFACFFFTSFWLSFFHTFSSAYRDSLVSTAQCQRCIDLLNCASRPFLLWTCVPGFTRRSSNFISMTFFNRLFPRVQPFGFLRVTGFIARLESTPRFYWVSMAVFLFSLGLIGFSRVWVGLFSKNKSIFLFRSGYSVFFY